MSTRKFPMEENILNIGKNLRKLRKILNLTQVEFSNKLRISKGFLSNLEKGVRHPSSQLLKLISYEFSASENWLLTGQGEMFISPEDALKNQIARFGERAILESIISLTNKRDVFIIKESQVPYATNPELERMHNTLHLLWISGDERFKNWVSVQFDRAFPKDVIEEAQKKTKRIPWASLRQLNLQLLLAQVS